MYREKIICRDNFWSQMEDTVFIILQYIFFFCDTRDLMKIREYHSDIPQF